MERDNVSDVLSRHGINYTEGPKGVRVSTEEKRRARLREISRRVIEDKKRKKSSDD